MPSQIWSEGALWVIFGLFVFQLIVLLIITWPKAGDYPIIPATDLDGELAELKRNPHAWSRVEA